MIKLVFQRKSATSRAASKPVGELVDPEIEVLEGPSVPVVSKRGGRGGRRSARGGHTGGGPGSRGGRKSAAQKAKEKEDENRIAFEPPNYQEECKLEYDLHNATCPHNICTYFRGLPKFAAEQTGWLRKLREMRKLKIVDQKRAKLVLNKKKRKKIRKKLKIAIALRDIKGNVHLTKVKVKKGRKLRRKTLLRLIFKKIKLKRWKGRLRLRRKGRNKLAGKKITKPPVKVKSVPSTSKATPDLVVLKHIKKGKVKKLLKKPQKKPRKTRKIRKKKPKIVRYRNGVRIYTEYERMKMRIKKLKKERKMAKKSKKPITKKIQKSTSVWLRNRKTGRKRKVLMTKVKRSWIRRRKMTKYRKPSGFVKKMRLRMRQTIWYKEELWIVVGRLGSKKRGYEYTLVPNGEFLGEKNYQFVRSKNDMKYRYMTNEKNEKVKYVTSVPYLKPKPEVHHYPTLYKGRKFTKEEVVKFREMAKKEDAEKGEDGAEKGEDGEKKVAEVVKDKKAKNQDKKTVIKKKKEAKKVVVSEEKASLVKKKTEKKKKKKPKKSETPEANKAENLKTDKKKMKKKKKAKTRVEEPKEKAESAVSETPNKKKKVKTKKKKNDKTEAENMEKTKKKSEKKVEKEKPKKKKQKLEKNDDLKVVEKVKKTKKNTKTPEKKPKKSTKTDNKKKKVTFKSPENSESKSKTKPMKSKPMKKLDKKELAKRKLAIKKRLEARNYERIDSFEKGVDIRMQPVPFVEEFIIDDHAIVAFTTLEDHQTFDDHLAKRRRQLIFHYWYNQIRTVCIIPEDQKSYEKKKKRYLKYHRRKATQARRAEYDHIEKQLTDKCEEIRIQIEAMLAEHGDCPLETIDAYFLLVEELRRRKVEREDRIAEIRAEKMFEKELEEARRMVKKKFSIRKIMMDMVMNRHKLTLQLVTSGSKTVEPANSKKSKKQMVPGKFGKVLDNVKKINKNSTFMKKPVRKHQKKTVLRKAKKEGPKKWKKIKGRKTMLKKGETIRYITSTGKKRMVLKNRRDRQYRRVAVYLRKRRIDRHRILTLKRETANLKKNSKNSMKKKENKEGPPTKRVRFAIGTKLDDEVVEEEVKQVKKVEKTKKQEKVDKNKKEIKKPQAKASKSKKSSKKPPPKKRPPRILLGVHGKRKVGCKKQGPRYTELMRMRSWMETMTLEQRLDLMKILKSYSLTEMMEYAKNKQMCMMDRAVTVKTQKLLERVALERSVYLQSDIFKFGEKRIISYFPALFRRQITVPEHPTLCYVPLNCCF